MAPIFFDYPRNEHGQKKVNIALKTFETYLQRNDTKYAAGNELTIADLPLVTATMCLEAIDFRFDDYPLIVKWYSNFKAENPKLWEICTGGMEEIEEFNKNPPDLSKMNHPIHPIRKSKWTEKKTSGRISLGLTNYVSNINAKYIGNSINCAAWRPNLNFFIPIYVFCY